MQETEVTRDHHAMVRALAARLRRELALGGEFDDLVAYGFGGLLEAKRRFDASRGVRFNTYAYYRIRGAILDGVRQMAPLSRRAVEDARVHAQRTPTAAPTPLDRAFTRISASLTAASPLHGRYGDQSPETILIRQESIRALLQALERLPERHRQVIRRRYFEGWALNDVAKELGISKSWASRLHAQALGKLKAEVERTGSEKSAE